MMNKQMRKDRIMKVKCYALFFVLMLVVSQAVADPLSNVVLYDNFSDGNFDGWTIGSIINPDADYIIAPDIVASPEDYSIRGVGSGYANPVYNGVITHTLPNTIMTELKIEMRAKSGAQWPNSVWIYLISGNDRYSFSDYGESNQSADFLSFIAGQDYLYRVDIGSLAHEWHDFAWTRDANGWWSFSLDNGLIEVSNFHQDVQLTSFDHIEISLLRNQSEIEWVRLSVPEPATISLLVIGGLTLLKRRRKS